jgi:hypothetical protein
MQISRKDPQADGQKLVCSLGTLSRPEGLS